MLQTQFSEVEAAVLDYQNEALVAFVAAPSIRGAETPVVAPAPAEWAVKVTGVLAEQLPPPSVPTRIFLVDGFVMKPLSGKIDRACLPNISHLLETSEPQTASIRAYASAGARRSEDVEVAPADAGSGISAECEEVLAICKAVFEMPLGPDDGFVEAGGHSITIARLAQRLQAAGWVVPVRALFSGCDTARKVAARPRVLQPALEVPQTVTMDSERNGVRRDEAAAAVLPIGYFTALQVLFGILLYLPGIASLAFALAYIEIGTFFSTASLGAFIGVDAILYLLGLAAPFAGLLWVMLIKVFMSGDIYANKVTPGLYPKWSKMHLRIWCIGRLEGLVLLPLRLMYRSAPLEAFALRQLGATVGRNLQCAHDADLSGPLDLLSIGDDVAVQTGAYIHATRWSDGQLRIGPVRLEDGCKIGMRAAVANDVTVGRGSWITPFTPVISDVGSQEIWEGAPAKCSGRCAVLERTAKFCRYAHPVWLLETLNILMQTVVFFCLNLLPIAVILWFARGLIPAGEAELSSAYSRATPLYEVVWHLNLYAFVTTWASVVVTSLLTCLFIRLTAASPGLYTSRGLKGALLMFRMVTMNRIQEQWTWTITGQYLRALAGMRFPRVGGSECDLMLNLVPELAAADSRVFWSNRSLTNMLDYGAEHIKLSRLDMPQGFFSGNNCVAEHGQLPSNFLLGVSTPASDIQFRRQMRSRPGEPITAAGSPPLKFAGLPEIENDPHRLPSFGLFLTRVFIFDFLSIGTLRITEGFIFTILFISLLRAGADALAGAAIAFVLTAVLLVLLSVAIKRSLVGDWGANHAAPFWSWRHFAYFFAQDCFFIWCRGPLWFCAGTILSNPVLRWMGCRIGRRTIVNEPLGCFDWNAVSFGSDCFIDGMLQFHTFERQLLKVKRTHIGDRCTVAFGATVMGGAVIERDTTLAPLSMVFKEMSMLTATYEGSPAEPVNGSMVLPGIAFAAPGYEHAELPEEAA
jgi:non-ribosomal peptide synthetase-like protein